MMPTVNIWLKFVIGNKTNNKYVYFFILRSVTNTNYNYIIFN